MGSYFLKSNLIQIRIVQHPIPLDLLLSPGQTLPLSLPESSRKSPKPTHLLRYTTALSISILSMYNTKQTKFSHIFCVQEELFAQPVDQKTEKKKRKKKRKSKTASENAEELEEHLIQQEPPKFEVKSVQLHLVIHEIRNFMFKLSLGKQLVFILYEQKYKKHKQLKLKLK